MTGRIKQSLVVKTALLFLSAAAVPYLLASVFFFGSAREALNREISKGLAQQTRLIRDTLDARLTLIRGNAVAWADLDVMGDIVADDIDKRIAITIEGLKKDYRLEGDIHVLNGEGKIVASTDPARIGAAVEEAPMEVVMKGKTAEIDVYDSERLGTKAFAFAAPLLPSFSRNRAVGALFLELRADRLIDASAGEEQLHLALITGDGRLFAASSGEDEFRGEALRLNGSSEETVRSPTGHILSFAMMKGDISFAGFGWTVVGAVSEDIALGPVHRIEWTALGIVITGIVLILLLVTLFARRTVKPLADLSVIARRIAETKDFSASVYSTRQDEVGQLAEAFNGMVAEINAYIERMQEMEEEIRRADRLSAVGELSAGMAHEIKNPLGVIRSSADLLKDRLDKSSQEGLLASAIAEESQRLTKLLEAFLQFARPRPPQLAPCRLNEVVEKSIVLLESEMVKSGIELDKKLDGAIPPIISDANQLHQVLVNLIINAIQAMPEGGRLTLSTKTSSLAIPKSGETVEAVELAVEDSGAGIDPAVREKIFNPFYTTKEKGTGLGLSIVYRIINGLGGEVRIDAGKERGTVFRITLPLEREE